MPARISLHKLSALALLFGVVAVAVLLTAQSAEAATTKVEAGRLYMLELINQARQEAGVEPVVLGDSPVAQDHADAMLSDCFVAHWGLDGLKPYMRYSIAGGYQTNAENLVGLDYCVTASDGYSPIEGVREKVREHMEILMDSEGHRAAILYPWYKKVSIGLAWDTYNFWTAQLFEGDYVVYEHLPRWESSDSIAFFEVIYFWHDNWRR